MKNERTYKDGRITLSVAIVISSIIIGYSLIEASINIADRLDQISSEISQGNVMASNNYISEQKDSEILSFGETARYIGIEGNRLKILIESHGNTLPYKRLGENYYFSKTAIDEWFSSGIMNVDY